MVSSRRVCWCGNNTRRRPSMQCRGWNGSWKFRSWTQECINHSVSTKCPPFTYPWLMSTMTLFCCLRDTAELRECKIVWFTSEKDFLKPNEWKGLASLSENSRRDFFFFLQKKRSDEKTCSCFLSAKETCFYWREKIIYNLHFHSQSFYTFVWSECEKQ